MHLNLVVDCSLFDSCSHWCIGLLFASWLWNFYCSFSEVGGVWQYLDDGSKWIADCVRNHVKGKTFEHNEVHRPVFRPNRAALLVPSRISCIRLGPKCSPHTQNDGSVAGRVLYPFDFLLLFLCHINMYGQN